MVDLVGFTIETLAYLQPTDLQVKNIFTSSRFANKSRIWTVWGSNLGRGKTFFSSPEQSRPVHGPTQPHVQSVPGLIRGS